MSTDQLNSGPRTFSGVPVRTSVLIPEFQGRERLSQKVLVSDSFREAYDVWLREIFGETALVLELDAAYVMHPNTLTRLQAALARDYPVL